MSLAPPAIYPSSAHVPVLLSVPHAGRDYPDWLIALSKGGAQALHALEDPARRRPCRKRDRQGHWRSRGARAPRRDRLQSRRRRDRPDRHSFRTDSFAQPASTRRPGDRARPHGDPWIAVAAADPSLRAGRAADPGASSLPPRDRGSARADCSTSSAAPFCSIVIRCPPPTAGLR